MSIVVGALAPRFVCATTTNPRYTSAAFGGRYVLLAFLPTDPEGRRAALSLIVAHRGLFDDVKLSTYGVLRDETTIGMARDQTGLRWFLDRDGAVSRLFEALTPGGEARPRWVLLDPAECVLATADIDKAEDLFALIQALPAPQDHAGVPLHAPVLIAPRIFDRDLCRRLIAHYEADGGTPSGVMREIDGRTVGVLDNYKKRRDTMITDLGLVRETHQALMNRLFPQIRKAFQFKVSHIERNMVACYDAQDGGYFKPHRDDTTPGTAHRRFACSINLNAEDFEGGDLTFAEFGPKTYRPPTGGAVIFSCSLLHEATAVTKGKRYAFLPFFYDAEAAAIRVANRETSETAAEP
ncbi:2OG-Fe(II) oxygenase [Phenylobacterium sp.]|uniref:2OG-Fe(II) oxygenase family protein n=1 Tax=Phenylobacterium sp. TaxID=1871053 RepID=UPI0027378C6F|nr:2OG-Fe(II) oxygenase [Phenylobacterium sp.]MDP3869113.1 2OG-Fe(II) oxygenase [Phenylobacterium sp.]